jgi:hypothetical protein
VQPGGGGVNAVDLLAMDMKDAEFVLRESGIFNGSCETRVMLVLRALGDFVVDPQALVNILNANLSLQGRVVLAPPTEAAPSAPTPAS